jgi:thioredoxin 1
MSRETTDRRFEADVLKATSPVVVDFWAAWCGPCTVLAPVVEDLAQEYRGKVEFVKLDVDENPESVSKYGIQSIPTLLGQQAQAPICCGQPMKAVARK